MQEPSEGAHLARQRLGYLRPPLAAVEKAQRLQEVLIVIAFVGLVAGKGQHAIGRRGQEQGSGGVTVAA